MERTLTVRIRPDWKSALSASMDESINSGRYMGEFLDFTSPTLFFSKLTDNRWNLVNLMQGAGEIGVRELARRAGRDVRRIHDDAAVLVDLGLIERTDSGKLICPFVDIHVDMHLRHAA